MITISNDMKVKDIPEPSLRLEIEKLIKLVMMDYGMTLTQEVFAHTIKRLTYLIQKKYKGFLLGEVKYILEETTEHMKSKLSVAAIMYLFQKYYDDKVERQKQAREELDINYASQTVNCLDNPVGHAIIHKMEMLETGKLTMAEWDSIPLRQIAKDIKEGTRHIAFKSRERKPWKIED